MSNKIKFLVQIFEQHTHISTVYIRHIECDKPLDSRKGILLDGWVQVINEKDTGDVLGMGGPIPISRPGLCTTKLIPR